MPAPTAQPIPESTLAIVWTRLMAGERWLAIARDLHIDDTRLNRAMTARYGEDFTQALRQRTHVGRGGARPGRTT